MKRDITTIIKKELEYTIGIDVIHSVSVGESIGDLLSLEKPEVFVIVPISTNGGAIYDFKEKENGEVTSEKKGMEYASEFALEYYLKWEKDIDDNFIDNRHQMKMNVIEFIQSIPKENLEPEYEEIEFSGASGLYKDDGENIYRMDFNFRVTYKSVE